MCDKRRLCSGSGSVNNACLVLSRACNRRMCSLALLHHWEKRCVYGKSYGRERWSECGGRRGVRKKEEYGREGDMLRSRRYGRKDKICRKQEAL